MSKSKSADAEKLIQQASRSSFYPSSVWWKGPGEVHRPTAEPDEYGVVAKIDAKAWKDRGRSLLFGPAQKTKTNPYPIWSHTIVKTQDRLKVGLEPPHAKTEPDHYDVKFQDTMFKRARSLGFPRSNAVRDLKYHIKRETVNRAFNKDFSRSGSCLAF